MPNEKEEEENVTRASRYYSLKRNIGVPDREERSLSLFFVFLSHYQDELSDRDR